MVLHVFLLWQEKDLMARGYGDFAAFYTAGMMVNRGQAELLYDRPAQWRLQQEFASTVEIRRGPLPYIRPPFEALLFAGLARFRYPVACALWMALKLACLLGVPFLLRRLVPLPQTFSPWLAGLLCVGFFPVFYDLLQGQDAILFLFLLVLALGSLVKKREALAGVFLGMALIKFHLAVPIVLVFVIRRRWRVLAGFSVTAAVLLLISVQMTGWPALQNYPRYLWELNRMPGAGVITWRSMPNLRGLWTAVTPNIAGSPYAAALLVAVALIILLWVARYCFAPRRRDAKRITASFSLVLAATLLTSYYCYNYDLSVLLIPMLLLSEGGSSTPPKFRLLYRVCVLLLLTSPLYWWLLFRVDSFYLAAIILAGLAVALAGMADARAYAVSGSR